MLKKSFISLALLTLLTVQGHAEEAKKETKLNKNAYVAEWQTITVEMKMT